MVSHLLDSTVGTSWPQLIPPVEIFYAAPSRTGYGLFSHRSFAAGQLLFTLHGQLMDGFFANHPLRGDAENAFQLGRDFYLMPTTPEGLFLNHSCDPNAALRHDLDVYSRRDIAQGEEIRIDYSTCIAETAWQMACGCGSLRCRRLIKSFWHLSPDLRRSYLQEGIVQQFLVDEAATHEVQPPAGVWTDEFDPEI